MSSAFIATQITIGTSKVNLFDAITGAVTGADQAFKDAQSQCSELSIQCDLASGGTLYLGGDKLSTSNYGLQLAKGAVQRFGPLISNGVDLLSIYLLGSAASTLVNVMVRVF